MPLQRPPKVPTHQCLSDNANHNLRETGQLKMSAKSHLCAFCTVPVQMSARSLPVSVFIWIYLLLLKKATAACCTTRTCLALVLLRHLHRHLESSFSVIVESQVIKILQFELAHLGGFCVCQWWCTAFQLCFAWNETLLTKQKNSPNLGTTA